MGDNKLEEKIDDNFIIKEFTTYPIRLNNGEKPEEIYCRFTYRDKSYIIKINREGIEIPGLKLSSITDTHFLNNLLIKMFNKMEEIY